MVTLTFADGDEQQARGAMRNFIAELKKRYRVEIYFWWAELQARGVVHYHILIPNSPWIDDDWLHQVWPWGNPSVRWKDGTRGVWYAIGYAKKVKKQYQQDYSLFSQLYKHFRAFSSNRIRDWFARSWKFPAWLREKIWEVGECPIRIGLGWLFRSTGELVRSPWRLAFAERLEGGGWCLVFDLG